MNQQPEKKPRRMLLDEDVPPLPDDELCQGGCGHSPYDCTCDEEPVRCSAYDGGQGCLRPATEFGATGLAYCSRCWKLATTEGES